jgi:hypothetical protein
MTYSRTREKHRRWGGARLYTSTNATPLLRSLTAIATIRRISYGVGINLWRVDRRGWS